ncbi:unnamed protein product [Gongylonema pulchrum]|uniref:glucuronosyltransferase n=1 Tax=Gongylonema pulchrum TaxID=637853 RepID=A0A183D4U1_9BILA|nr:unnamed protein product [Gongylonema pulchrum]
MEKSEDGVVLVSFGTVFKGHYMSTDGRKILHDAFRQLPQITFIWKYEIEDNTGLDLPNVIKTKWFPQNDLLSEFLQQN